MQWATGITKSSPSLAQGDIFVTLVVDLKGVSVGQVTNFSTKDIRRGIKMWQGTYLRFSI